MEGALLVGPGSAVAVVVEAGLTDRDALLVRGQRLQLGEVSVVEAARLVRVSTDRRVHLREVLGRHPNEATGFDGADLAELKALAAHEKCVAIGETGLDFYRDTAPPAPDQERAFAAQIELAGETGKPLVIHTRAAEDDTLRMLSERAGGVRVILHCFSMASRIEECLAHPDWWISFAGNVTYPKAGDLRGAALRVPSERLLVETDAPYLSPQAARGKPNQPANVVLTAHALAVERRVPYAELEQAIERSAATVFGW